MSLLELLLILVASASAAYFVVRASKTRDDRPQRRWARVAQRRAPARPAADSGLDELIEYIDDQLRSLLTERHRLSLLIERGRRLRDRMQRSAQHRAAVPTLERQMDLLRRRGEQIDELIGRYHQQREDLRLVRDSRAFNDAVAAVAGGSGGTVSDVRVSLDELEEESQRLLDVADAERELEVLLRT